MNVQTGKHVYLTTSRGEVTEFIVTAIRRFPFPFAELEPCGGGVRRTVRLSEFERIRPVRLAHSDGR